LRGGVLREFSLPPFSKQHAREWMDGGDDEYRNKKREKENKK
jgi:hypothetical protein